MSLRSRPTTTKQTSIPASPPESPTAHQPPASLSQRTLTQTLTGTANLANLLPTGTLLALQLLTPTFTSGGACDSATRPMTAALLCLLALSCFLASFTDSFRSPTDGQVYYGFATFKGLWLFDSRAAPGPDSDLKKYRATLIDWVHGAASVLVFAAVAMRDKSVLSCFFPTPSREVQEVLNAAPLAVGLISSFLFMVFPTRRHGIGYPVTTTK
ncbi:hypothetical protein RHGRI_009779 [Rhododendron griersonianum]|uniref:Uncharacterized protein n=1 Tax=Rhododendron griersonianum TaxID=479676 RepID=A0AAV6KG09_9ERIC|nr:hypothetical protein RHGRI_009779 [Rhododendron griersonianum]